MPEHLSFEEQRAVDGAKLFLGDGGGYWRQQATRPQTIGYALSDFTGGPGDVDLRKVLQLD
jgi:hypothetical protein